MSDASFMMGEFEARIPADRDYSDTHMWLQQDAEDATVYRVGFTAYSVRMLQDIYFLDWSIDANTQIKKKQDIGEIESSKAVSALFAPAAGLLTEFNDDILDDPSAINSDNYGKGWLFKLKMDEPLLTAQQYVELLDSTWEKTQRMIKGQMN